MTIRFSEITVIVREGGPFRRTGCGACGQIVTLLIVSHAVLATILQYERGTAGKTIWLGNWILLTI